MIGLVVLDYHREVTLLLVDHHQIEKLLLISVGSWLWCTYLEIKLAILEKEHIIPKNNISSNKTSVISQII